MPSPEPVTPAAELRQAAALLRARGERRNAASPAGERPCDGDCRNSDCHTVSAVSTWHFAANLLEVRADELESTTHTTGKATT